MKFHNYIYGQTWSMVATIDRMAQLKYSESYLKEILNNDKNSKNLKDTITHGKIEFKNLKYSYIIKPKDTPSTHPPSPSDSNHSTEEKVINVLNNFNLTIKSKEKIAFLGKSGSGKSTLMKLLVRLLNLNPPNSGEILIDNINIQDININYLRKNVNYINQNTMLFDEDVYYNIKYGNKMDEDLNSYPPEPSPEINQITNNNNNNNTNSNEINTNQKIENILRKYDLLTIYDNLDTKLHTKAGPKGTNLSHGMQKVTIIMRGIMRNSKIIILDEPLAGLDSKTREKIIKLILNECKNRTIIIITHDKEILPYMDRVVDINDINDKILSPSNS
jgi:ABC-type multidrug transport system fused ATPase/permease subunit